MTVLKERRPGIDNAGLRRKTWRYFCGGPKAGWKDDCTLHRVVGTIVLDVTIDYDNRSKRETDKAGGWLTDPRNDGKKIKTGNIRPNPLGRVAEICIRGAGGFVAWCGCWDVYRHSEKPTEDGMALGILGTNWLESGMGLQKGRQTWVMSIQSEWRFSNGKLLFIYSWAEIRISATVNRRLHLFLARSRIQEESVVRRNPTSLRKRIPTGKIHRES